MKEEKKQSKLLDKGEKLYDDFLKKTFGRNRMKITVSTPRTNTLELFAVLDEQRESELLIGAMCLELADAICPESLFAENGKLFKYERVKKSF